MEGKRALFPFSFHCTGMPIAAAAKRLVLEEKFEKEESKEEKKGITQKDILVSLGVPEDEIDKFKDPEYWLDYFTPYGMQDLKSFGL
jgi:leucyl-tRNA synthetase